MRVATNYQSMVARRQLGDIHRRQTQESTKLASGSRVYEAAFDPSGLAISTGMKAKSISNSQVQRNVNDGVSLLQVAEGTLSVLHNVSGRLRELAMQAANDTVGTNERLIADKEFQGLIGEIKRLVSSTKYNGNHVINGQGSVYELQIGTGSDPMADRLRYDLKKVLDSADNFGMTGETVSTKEGARRSFAKVDGMLNEISNSRAKLGGAMNRMESTLQNLQVHKENIDSSRSKIADTDVAESVSENVKLKIMKDASASLLTQANMRSAAAVKLIDA